MLRSVWRTQHFLALSECTEKANLITFIVFVLQKYQAAHWDLDNRIKPKFIQKDDFDYESLSNLTWFGAVNEVPVFWQIQEIEFCSTD